MGILGDLRFKDMQRSTWITHTIGSIVWTLGWGIWLGPFAGLAASWTAVLTFVAKEQKDKVMHLLRGDYDIPDASGVAPRSDHIGDLLGPVSIALGNTIGVILMLL